MKLLFVAVAFLLTAAAPLLAQDIKTYEDMTLAELEAVNTKSLTREEKRLYKSALKAAKKAEKERIKAEKKRLRAEKKAEKKRLKKALKVAEQRYRYVEDVYKKTRFSGERSDGLLTFRGVSSDFNDTLFSGNVLHGRNQPFFLKSSLNESSGNFQTHVDITFSQSTKVIFSDSQEVVQPPEWYWEQKGGWPMFYKAFLRNGRQLHMEVTGQHFSKNGDYYVSWEYVDVNLDWSIMEAAVRANRHVDIKLLSRKREPSIVRVPYEYMIGYGMKIAASHKGLVIDQDMLDERYQSLKQDAARLQVELAALR